MFHLHSWGQNDLGQWCRWCRCGKCQIMLLRLGPHFIAFCRADSDGETTDWNSSVMFHSFIFSKWQSLFSKVLFKVLLFSKILQPALLEKSKSSILGSYISKKTISELRWTMVRSLLNILVMFWWLMLLAQIKMRLFSYIKLRCGQDKMSTLTWLGLNCRNECVQAEIQKY